MRRLTRLARRFRLWLVAGGLQVDLLGYAAVLLLALGVQSWSGFHYLEWKLYDESLKLLRAHGARPVVNDVVIIAIDEASFRAFDEPFALWHGHIGALIDAMVLAQPAVLGLDLVLPAKSYDVVLPGIDHRLLEPLLRARGKLKLVLAQTLDDELQPRPIFPGFVALVGAQNLASAVLCFDDDSVVRRVLPGRCDSGATAGLAPAEPPALAQRLAELLDAPARGHGLIDFRRGDSFTTVSMAQVLQWQAAGDVQALREHFGGRPVLVGVVLPLEDRLRVPVALLASEPDNTRLPGVMVHGQILRSILNDGYLQTAPRALVWALTALVCLCWFGNGFRKDLAYWTLFLMLPALGLYALWRGYAMAPAALLVSAQLAYAASQGLEALRLAHQRGRLAQAFAGHVDPRLLKRVLASDARDESDAIAAQRRQATVMWVQIPEDVPALAAGPPDASLAALSAFFDAVQQIVQRSGGMVDRFQGSAVLAYFGAPLPLRHHARAALEAALGLARSQPAWGGRLASGGSGLPRLSIGVATGEVVAGQAPMREARPFIMMGEPVQQAIALAGQAAADPGGIQVLVSAASAEAVGHTRLQALGPGLPGIFALDVR